MSDLKSYPRLMANNIKPIITESIRSVVMYCVTFSEKVVDIISLFPSISNEMETELPLLAISQDSNCFHSLLNVY